MSDTPQWFSCPGCRQRFAWKPAYAGRKVTCKCGHVFAPLPLYDEPESEYELAEDTPPAPAPRVAPPPSLSARPVSAAPVLQYRSAAPERVAARQGASGEGLPYKELYLPGVLVVVGAAFWAATRFLNPQQTGSPVASGILLLVLWVALTVVLMLASLLLSAKIMDIQLTTLGSTLAKLAFIAIVGTAAFVLGTMWDRDGSLTGYVIAFNIMIITYWVLFSGFFKLDFGETALTVAFVAILQAIAAVALVRPWW